MAQAIRNKDVRKNCIDVEKVVIECLEEPKRDNIHTIVDQIKRFDYAKFHQEFIPINQVKQKFVYKNYRVY
jgi:hypothetical protein